MKSESKCSGGVGGRAYHASMLKVYVPAADTRARSHMEAGAGIVGTSEGTDDDDDARTLVYYQERTSAVNVITFADRVFHAADRLRHQAQTHRLCALPSAQLIEVGYFDENEGRVLLDTTNADAAAELARWLDADELDASELECLGAQHFVRDRQLRAAARSANPALALWARQQARRQGLSV